MRREKEIGFLLRLFTKQGASLPHSRPMPSIGKGCHELRVNDNSNTWRIMYYMNAEAIVILDVFSRRIKRRKNPLLSKTFANV
ncbi:MAG: type II toxin-antitoxin system RelE/ParE family toxin [Chloroflexota bacterium]